MNLHSGKCFCSWTIPGGGQKVSMFLHISSGSPKFIEVQCSLKTKNQDISEWKSQFFRVFCSFFLFVLCLCKITQRHELVLLQGPKVQPLWEHFMTLGAGPSQSQRVSMNVYIRGPEGGERWKDREQKLLFFLPAQNASVTFLLVIRSVIPLGQSQM